MSPARGAALTFGALTLVAALPRIPGAPPALAAHAATLLTVAMLVLPQLHARLDPELEDVGLPVPPTAHELGLGLAASVTLIPAFFLLVRLGLWPHPPTGLRLELAALPAFAAVHLLTVVLPEELFFRAYMQPALDDGAGPGLGGVRLHRGLWVQALAFGLLHLVTYGSLQALDRALPALAFGWLREAGGSAWAPAVFHLACNLALYASAA